MNTRPMAFQNSDESSDLIPPAVPTTSSRYICFATFTYDVRRQALYRDGVGVKLPSKVHEILLILIEKSGEVVTREALRERLWPADVHVNYDANVNTTVNKLRQILGDSPEEPAFIETVPRQGYSFIAKVEYTDQPPPGAIQSKPLPSASSSGVAVASVTESSFIDSLRRSPAFNASAVILFILGILLGAGLVYLALHS
jgi:DNA-binding winged helix-turn-helix (wHTH) protein